MRIFFAGPLTNLTRPEETKRLYAKMGEIAAKNGFEYFWAFQSGTDPVKNPDVDNAYIYYKDLSELQESNLMIAYVGEPTTGTGQELEYAREHGIPVYLVFEKTQKVSRMILGNPAVEGTIEFEGETDALDKLDTLLKNINNKLKTHTLTTSSTDISVE